MLLYMLILHIMQVTSFFCRYRNAFLSAIGWLSHSIIVLAAVRGRSAVGNADHGCPKSFLPREKKLDPREIYASGGGLLVVPINAP